MQRASRRLAAVDLGASSGRVMVGTVGPDHLRLDEAHRFTNGPGLIGQSWRWDVDRIYSEMMTGLQTIAATGPLDGIGIDSWGVDYGLVDGSGSLTERPYCYRDSRTDGIAAKVHATVPADELFAITGLQELPFNTIYQLVASIGSTPFESADTLLLLPDLLNYWLTGRRAAERTNASTTQLYDARARTWAAGLAHRVGIPARLLAPLLEPGEVVGQLLPDVAAEHGLDESTPVIAVGSHDTASAVVAVPAMDDAFAYISSGTWSLVGVELDRPMLTDAARAANFTNEGGVDGTVRFLKNVMGLWILTESIAWWRDRGVEADLAELLTAAESMPALRTIIDVNDPRFLPPGAMSQRVAELAEEVGEPVPTTPAETTRCILDSLAVAYRRDVRQAAQLSGKAVSVVHIVGGGVHNTLLCQLTADACGLPVLAGPAEASALGNVLVQARALGVDMPDLGAMRELVRRTQRPRRYRPRAGDWAAAELRLTHGRR